LTPTPGGSSTGSNLVHYDLDTVNDVMTITWDDVGYYNSQTNKLNAFQLQLISLGNGDFDIVFRYEDINWTAGSASGGSNGLGGTPARAGYTAGAGNPSVELSQSGNQTAMLGLEDALGNTGIEGVHVFQVQSGVVTSAPVLNGLIAFSDPDTADSHTASFLPVNQGYLGTFSLDPLNQAANSVAWHLTLGSNEVQDFFNSSQIRTQAYDISINDNAGNPAAVQRVGFTVGTAADDDAFTFAPGMGQHTLFNFDQPASDWINLSQFGIDSFDDLVLTSVNDGNDTLVDLAGHDSLLIVGVNKTALQAVDFFPAVS
jgi:hypothetical protein